MLKTIARIVFVVLSVAYPFVIYFGRNHVTPQTMALVLLCLLTIRAWLLGWKNTAAKLLLLTGVLVSLATFLFGGLIGLLWYPCAINFVMLLIFSYSVLHPPTVIERLARLTDANLPTHAVIYTRMVTMAWCVFFVINGCISAWTALYASAEAWTFYNGLVAYVLMGLLFVLEWIIRYFYRKRHATA